MFVAVPSHQNFKSVDKGLSASQNIYCLLLQIPTSTYRNQILQVILKGFMHSSVLSSAKHSQNSDPNYRGTDEPQQITRIILDIQFLWSGMLSDIFKHVTVYDRLLQLTLQCGVTSTARHSKNITCRGVTSTARHAARSPSFVYISTT